MSTIGLATIVGRNIRTARRAADLTQSELATLIGASSIMIISRWERGFHLPSEAFLLKLSAVFQHGPEWFFTVHEPESIVA